MKPLAEGNFLFQPNYSLVLLENLTLRFDSSFDVKLYIFEV